MIWRVEFSGCASRREASLMCWRNGSPKAAQSPFPISVASPETSAALADSSTLSRSLTFSPFQLFPNLCACGVLDVSEWLILFCFALLFLRGNGVNWSRYMSMLVVDLCVRRVNIFSLKRLCCWLIRICWYRALFEF